MTSGRLRVGIEPGRLLSAMLRALAAELSDSGRFSRAMAYARDGAVIELDIRPGVASGLVLGSRRDPYEVLIAVDPAPADELAAADPARAGSMTLLVPGRDELAVSCTCPDADGTGWLGGAAVCKHAIAVLLVLADRTGADPTLLARWRSSSTGDVVGSRPGWDAQRLPRRGRAVGQAHPARIDILAGLVDAPARWPELPDIGRRAPVRLPASVDDPAARLAYELYADAVDALRGG